MTTEADEKLCEAKEYIKKALKCLNLIVMHEVAGSHNYNEGMNLTLKRCHRELMNIRDELEAY